MAIVKMRSLKKGIKDKIKYVFGISLFLVNNFKVL